MTVGRYSATDNPNGCVLSIDELDKLDSPVSWDNYVRQEIFALLDRNRTAFVGRNSDLEDDGWTSDTWDLFEERVLIVAAGTWQHLFQVHGKVLGFDQTPRVFHLIG